MSHAVVTLIFFFCFHHVDLKGEFNDIGTVPHQENIFSPRSSFFSFFFFHNVINFFTVVRLLCHRSEVQSNLWDMRPKRFQRGSLLWDEFLNQKPCLEIQMSLTAVFCVPSCHLNVKENVFCSAALLSSHYWKSVLSSAVRSTPC